MQSISDRAVGMLFVRLNDANSMLHAALIAACIAWAGLARADDVLDRRVQFNIAAAPLSSALVQFAAQSGVQVAVADADVAQRQSEGLKGNHSVQEGLSDLLRDSGLTFVRIGVTTIAIRSVPRAPAVHSTSSAGSVDQPAPQTSTDSAAKSDGLLPEVAVIAPRPPNAEELAGNSLYQFVLHHASTNSSAASNAVGAGLLRWRGGRSETICPATYGLSPAFNEFISSRVRAVVAYVGAPVQKELTCKPNVQIDFTTQPKDAMKLVLGGASKSLGVRFPHQMERELEVSGEHTIQGWYVTTGGGSRVLNEDAGLVGHIALQGLWPRTIVTGGDNNAGGRSILSVIVVVDGNKTVGTNVGPIADYIAFIALTFLQAPNHCDSLPSILDLMSSTCDLREKPNALTAGDVAFLKALYYHNDGLGTTLSRDDIVMNMKEQFQTGRR